MDADILPSGGSEILTPKYSSSVLLVFFPCYLPLKGGCHGPHDKEV